MKIWTDEKTVLGGIVPNTRGTSLHSSFKSGLFNPVETFRGYRGNAGRGFFSPAA